MTVQESQTNAVSPKPLRRNRLRAVFCALNFAIMVPLLLGLTLWAAAALYFDVRVPWLRLPLASVYVLGLLAAWVFLKRRSAVGLTAGAFALVLAWWFTLQPSIWAENITTGGAAFRVALPASGKGQVARPGPVGLPPRSTRSPAP